MKSNKFDIFLNSFLRIFAFIITLIFASLICRKMFDESNIGVIIFYIFDVLFWITLGVASILSFKK